MGVLYLVGTPIGNLADITLRALEVLGQVQLIASENPTVTSKLLAHYKIQTPLTSYHERSSAARVQELLGVLERGDLALVSTSGMPALSDPGYQLVRQAIAAGHTVRPIPGPTAAIAALVASGLPTDCFTFVGFLPRSAALRRKRLEELATLGHTLVFYESPHRLAQTVAQMRAVFGDRRCAIARELTKVHEEIWRGTLSEAEQRFSGIVRGEVTIVVEGRAEEPWPQEKVRALAQQLLQRGEPASRVAAEVAAASGWRRAAVYAMLVGHADEGSAQANAEEGN